MNGAWEWHRLRSTVPTPTHACATQVDEADLEDAPV